MSRVALRSALLLTSVSLSLPANAVTVWSGFTTTFSKPSFSDPTLPENQDRITDNVSLTRAGSQGLYNIRLEPGYSDSAPQDTLWATDLNNPGKNIAATNWADLTFTSWINAYGGAAS